MKPAPFAYHRAHSVAEAVALLAELGDEAKILAGGLSLVPMMNFRLARPAALVDVSRIGGLSYLRADPADGPTSALRIGALTTHRTVEISRDPAVLGGFGVLPRAARWIGHYPIRSRGTFGGSIAHADPASEWCLLAILLSARIVLAGPGTVAEPDEMITELWFPEPAPAAVLTEFAQRQGDFAVVAAAVSADIADGTCRTWLAMGEALIRVAYEVGRAINPMLVEGQLRGGVAQGIGGALLEEFRYDEDGQPQAITFIEYRLPTAAEIPPVDVLLCQDAPAPGNPLGVMGAGEGGISAVGAAVANAVRDALGLPGSVGQLPLTPARVCALAPVTADPVTGGRP